MNKHVVIILLILAFGSSPFYAQSETTSLIELKDKANKRDIVSQFELGKLYWFDPSNELEENKGMAFFFVEAAAMQGYVEAQSWLCLHYSLESKYQNQKKAYHWCKKGALQGDSYSQNIVAIRLLFGDDDLNVYKNERKAFRIFNASALGGNLDSIDILAYMYALGVGVEVNLTKAYAWYLVQDQLTRYSDEENREAVLKQLNHAQLEDAEYLSKKYLDTFLKKEPQIISEI